MLTLGSAIYILCLLSSVACAWLLVRSYVRSKTRLLLWSAACFFFLAINNLLVVIDLMVLPSLDLSLVRQGTAMVAVLVLLIGFIWELD
jgi:hypothetical protein